MAVNVARIDGAANDESSSDNEEDYSDDEGSEEWELWHAAYDQAGRKYYYHAESGETLLHDH